MNIRKKVAIIFIYLQNNLGDDLFLKHICLRYPHVDFYVMPTSVSNKMFDELDNLHFSEEMKTYFKEFDLPELSDKAKAFYKQFDACVVLGGSIFMQFNQAWRARLKNFKNRINLNKNTYVLGANFGPFTDPAFLAEHRAVFSELKDLCFRDSFSASFFPDAENIRYAPDILFSYKHDCNLPTKKKVAISVINCAWEGRPLPQLRRLKKEMAEYIDKLVEICSEFARKDYEISLLSFCGPQGDLNVANLIESKCLLNGVTNIGIYHYTGSDDAVLDELATSEIIAATRFHAMVLGFLLKKTVFPIIYDEKQKYVIQDLNFFGDTCLMEDIANLDSKALVESLIDPDSKNSFEKTKVNIENSIIEAEQQFKALDEILKREI